MVATLLTFCAICPSPSIGQPTPSARWLTSAWDAHWISPPDQPARAYGVHHFRRTFDLTSVPEGFVVHVSADNRYRLFVNGTPVNIGPARGDLRHWRFDTLDLAPWLKLGRNVLATQVWNFAEHGPVAQTTDQTAFILQGDDETSAVANTDGDWRAFTNPAYSPITGFGAKLYTYIVVGPGDDVDGARYPWGWEMPGFDDRSWKAASSLRRGTPRGISTDGKWLLVPRQIPLMESTPIRLQTVRRATGVEVSAEFVQGDAPFTIPAHSHATVLLDQAELTTGFPELIVSGGKGGVVTLTYAESLFEGPDSPATKVKGHRDEIEGKYLRGFTDTFRPDGTGPRTFRPLRWRTWRYLQADIATGDQPLTIVDLKAEFSAYPFIEHARFDSADDSLAGIWEIAWRTLRTGTHEIFTDSPYYEQLSYVGDSRIEALVSLYVSGDDRLMRKTIEAFDESRNPNGLTSSRWPDSRHQIIPPYSLVWISMVHDYWQLRDDADFVRARLAGVREVLRYFVEHSDPATGSYTGRQWWNYVDWISAWGRDPLTGLGGVPPRDERGASAILDLQHVYTLQQAAELMTAFGYHDDASLYATRAEKIREYVIATCWNDERGLLADTSERLTYSQHANTYLILTAGGKIGRLTDLARKIRDEPDLTPATFYFNFYTHQAMIAAGLGDDYLNWLDPWRGVLELGLTTVPEKPTPDTRSDSHAWGAHPMMGFLTTVLGIGPAGPGFKRVRIAPHLGDLPFARGAVPHPLGEISVDLRREGADGLIGTVTLPEGLGGVFEWQGHMQELQPGQQAISVHR